MTGLDDFCVSTLSGMIEDSLAATMNEATDGMSTEAKVDSLSSGSELMATTAASSMTAATEQVATKISQDRRVFVGVSFQIDMKFGHGVFGATVHDATLRVFSNKQHNVLKRFEVCFSRSRLES
jgi:hypothetical protein